jgi:AbrB family looped-hinge helix DNA binding protein
MSAATITLSNKGQIVIPKEIRDELHWEPGMRLTLVSTATGVTIRTLPEKSGRRLEDLVGMLKHDGNPLSTEDLCKPVDYGSDWGEEGDAAERDAG